MDDFLKITVMAVIQGLTEFLPVSSSGHLALAKHFMGLESPGTTLEIFLHAGTLVAVLLFYRKKLLAILAGLFAGRRESVVYAAWVLLSMAPVAVVYAAGKDAVESQYDNPAFVAWALCATGAVLAATAFAGGRRAKQCADSGGGVRFKWLHALAMGAAQAAAMLPGVSRSGSTIAAATLMGVKPKEAAEFSFIMSIPVIGGAVLLDVLKMAKGAEDAAAGFAAWQYAAGAAIAGVVGLAAIKGLIALLGKGKLWGFGVYCIFVGAAALCFL
jgi:Uncharacterized bacitracin resistance protein